MSHDPRIALVQDMFTAFLERGDIGPILAAVTDDVSFRVTVLPGTPVSGEFRGKDGLQTYFARNAETVEATELQVDSILAGGDQIAVVGRETMKVLRSGEVYRDWPWVTIFTFRGDQIERILIVEDTAPVWAAYAAAPTLR